MSNEPDKTDPLNSLKQFTAARIGLGRVGNSIPLKQSLELKLAHAHARDAVYSVLDVDGLTEMLKIFNLPVLLLYSQALTRHKYLKRPDLGRKLSDASAEMLKTYNSIADIAFIIADGLSAAAVNENAVNLLHVLLPAFLGAWLNIGPICLIEQGRVAVGDDIGYISGAKFTIVLIGERPGLSAANSMGAYLTYAPKPGLTDESRNCISNIRTGGLSHREAADKIFYLVMESFKRQLSGVKLKDNAGLLGS